MSKKRPMLRYFALAALFVVICVIYVARLINIQFVGREYYSEDTGDTYKVKETIVAQRGEIYDRNGNALVVNNYTRNYVFLYNEMPYGGAAKNEAVSEAVSLIRRVGDEDKLTDVNFPVLGSAPDYYFDSEFFESETKVKRLNAILDEHGVSENITAEQLVSHLLVYYGLAKRDGTLIYEGDDLFEVLARRFDMEYCRFSADTPYYIAKDLDVATLTAVRETRIDGTSVYILSSRSYVYPGYASHILGRTGKIPAEKLEEYTEKGYSLNATIGISGVEAAFEQYLHGTDGLRITEYDAEGNIVNQYVEKEPSPGQDVYLTIDINLQITAEDSLAENIQYIVDSALASGVPLSGEDAKAGAITAVDIKTGGVLVCASYPSYDLTTFSEDYSSLVEDERAPLLNRALNGNYTPGSTFKIATAAAALTEGIVNSAAIIVDKGKYEYYADYQPACWIYNRHGYGHGPQNVTQAIQNSCNYYFFEVGRLLTIEKLEKYCRALGLGEKTGVELSETAGVLDCPTYRDESGSDVWQVGDVLQVAIGQGKSQFSPLQICSYISAIINGGQRNSLHFLSEVKQFGTDAVTTVAESKVLGTFELSDYNRAVLLNAMKDVVESGSAASVFSGYPITIGGKTGTAQVNENKSANAIFTCFAPFNNPEIEVTVVIEQGNSGTTAGRSAKAIFDTYFGLDGEDSASDEESDGQND